MKVLGIIPARGGSKGIPRKNIKPLAGKPLIVWTAEAALASGLDRVVLSSEDPEIISVAKAAGVDVPFIRPAEFAQDKSSGLDVVLHAAQAMSAAGYRPDAVMILQPTSPLRTSRHIDEAIALFATRPEADSLVSVVRAPHNMIPESLMRLGSNGLLSPFMPWDEKNNSRQMKPTYYARNGAAIYLVRMECLLDRRSLYGNSILAYEMDKHDSVDIDDMLDFEICDHLMRKRLAAGGN